MNNSQKSIIIKHTSDKKGKFPEKLSFKILLKSARLENKQKF